MSELLSLIAPIRLLPRRLQTVGGVVAVLLLPVAWPLEVAGTYSWVVGTTLRQSRARSGLIVAMIAVSVLFEGFWLRQSYLFIAGSGPGVVHASQTAANDQLGSVAGVATADGQTATVASVDGPILTVRYQGQTIGVRLLGLNIPQAKGADGTVDCFGQEAIGFLSTMASGQTITLQADAAVADKDKAGNWQRYVFLSNGTLLNQLLLSQGDAQLDGSQGYQYYSVFSQAQDSAKATKNGLWGACSNQPTPTPSDTPSPTPTDKAGQVLGVNQLLAHPQPGPSPTPLPGNGQTFGTLPIPSEPTNQASGYQQSPPPPTTTPKPPATPSPTPTSPPATPTPTPAPTDTPTPVPT